MKMKKIESVIFALVTLFCLSSCGKKEWYVYEGAVWGTSFHIDYCGDKNLNDSINLVMRRVELSLSPFDKESLISKINRGEDAECDSDMVKVYNCAKYVWRISGGAFDPSVAPAVNLWGFGYKGAETQPDEDSVERVKALVGLGKSYIENGFLKHAEGMEFDFSAITKGFGCDMVGEMLERNGCENYMVEIGGEISLKGKNRRGEKWHIMIDAPVENNSEVVHERMAIIELTDCGIATSGNYRNYRETETGKVWHTIDPRSCRPAEGNVLSATVIAENAMIADALATACMVLPPDSAMAMVKSVPGSRVMLVLKPVGSSGELEMLVSEEFPEIN